MYRSAHEQMEMTEYAAYSTHQPQHTSDVYEPVTTTTTTTTTTTSYIQLVINTTTAFTVFAYGTHSVCTTIRMLEM